MLLRALVPLLLISPFAAAAAPQATPAAPPAATAQEGTSPFRDLPAIPGAIRHLILAGDYDEALGAIDQAAEERAEHADGWMYLRASVLALAEQPVAAVTQLEALEREHADGDWYYKARFLRADILRSMKQHAAAEAIYEAEAKRLRSADRQRELAGIYLGFAHRLSTVIENPAPDEPGPDYRRAYNLFEKVLDLGAPADSREDALYGMARALEELQDWGSARNAYFNYLEAFGAADDFSLAGIRSMEARYRIARSAFYAGDANGARRLFEDMLAVVDQVRRNQEPWAGAFDALGEDRPRLDWLEGNSRFAIGHTYQGNDSHSVAMRVAAFQRFLAAVPAHPRAGRARFQIAETLQTSGRLAEALRAYQSMQGWTEPAGLEQDVREENERLRQRSLFRRGQVLAQMEQFDDAIATFQDYVGRYSAGEDWGAAQQAMVDTEYQIGVVHRREKRFDEARAAWTTFLDNHPLDARGRRIALDLGLTWQEQAEHLHAQAADRDAEADPAAVQPLLRSALAQWERLARKYPNTNEASEALYRSGWVLENDLQDLEASIDSYRKCNFGSHSGSAQQRLVIMTNKSLEVSTERTWRGKDSAQVRVQVRNSKKLTVRIYPFDLQAYFRKHLTHQRIEDLDLDLIAADQEIEIDVEDYEKYKPIQQDISLPVKGNGVWAVAVEDGERRATTLVIRSDLDMVVKSSRREVFVYAQDMAHGRPARGAKVLVAVPRSGDTPLLHELTTDRDGIARMEFDELHTAEQLRLFAFRGDDNASDGLALSGLGMSQGLLARGYLYTDRSAYRPGQSVQWRGVLREVLDGSWHFEAGREYDLEIADSQGRVLSKRRLALSEYGTLNGEIRLDAYAPVGQYLIRCSRPNGPTFQGSFQVQDFQLQEIEIAVEFERRVYYRGETVKGTVNASYYYGEAVADAALQVQLPDGRQLALRTDAKGAAEFEIPTRDLPDSAALRVQATLPEQGVAAYGSVWVSAQGFHVAVNVEHDVMLVGNSFAVDVTTTDAAGEAVARDLELKVYRRDSTRGGWRDTLIQENKVATDEEGRLRQTLSLQKGGTHILRVEGRDRFDNPVVAEDSIWISGDEDTTRLRLLADSMNVEVGEKLVVDLHNRSGAGIALLTFEGESIFEYRLVDLRQGSNRMELDIEHDHWPNFMLAAAAMRGNRFHEAASAFEVARQLQVRLVPGKQEYRPGDTASVALEVTDQLGRPVHAELSLAVVDESIFAMFQDPMPGIRQYFEQDARRFAGMRTTSSCTFSYQGVSRDIARAVLEEFERELAEGAWADDRDSLREELDRQSDLRLRRSNRGLESVMQAQAGRPMSPGSPAPQTAAIINGLDKAGNLRFQSGEALTQLGYLGRDGAFFDAGVNAGFSFGLPAGGGGGGGRAGGEALARNVQAELAFWTPSVISDKDGHATIEFEVPRRSTRWRLTCRGVGPGTLLGQDVATVTAKSDFFVELATPARLVEGDQPRLMARVHNLSGLRGEAQLRLRLSGGEFVQSFPGTFEFNEHPVREFLFPLSEGLPALEELLIEAEVILVDEDKEVARANTARSVEVAPWGVEYSAFASGVLTSDAVIDLALPPGQEYRSRTLELVLTHGLERMLIDEALGEPAFLAQKRSYLRPTQADAASDLLGVVGAMKMVGAGSGSIQFGRLRDRSESLVARLVAAQRPDGGWGWAGKRHGSEPETSSRSMHALAAALQVGVAVPPQVVQTGLTYLDAAFRATGQSENERKAMLLLALAAHGQGDFGAANRLHRVRQSLSPSALAYTAMALVEMERLPIAGELADLLQLRLETSSGLCSVSGNLAWNRSPIGMTALASLVFQRTGRQAAARSTVDALLAERPWSPRRARGLAVAATAEWQGQTRPNQESTDVRVEIDGEPLVIQVDSASEVVGMSEEGFSKDRVKVRLSVSGQGRPFYQLRLSGFSSKVEERHAKDFRIARHLYQAAEPVYDGRRITTGFRVLSDNRNQWSNLVSQLPRGQMTRVTLDFYRTYDNNQDVNDLDYLQLRVPLPSGTVLLEGSLSGSFQDSQVRDNEIVLQVGQHRGTGRIHYTLVGSLPGDFRCLPARLESVFEPDRFALSEPYEFKVLDRGEDSVDKYKATPDELYNLGLAQLEAGDEDGAFDLLTRLWSAYGDRLKEDPLKTTAGKLLFLAIDRRDAGAVVRYFEVLKEKDPALNIPFDKVLAVGDAYRELEEYERALLIFRATIEETFGKDLKVAGTLEEQAEMAGATSTLERLWLEFPDLPVVVETYLALSDKLLVLAPGAHRDASLKQAGLDRAALTLGGIQLLDRFLAHYPDDPMAADAGLNLVSAYLGLEDFATAEKIAGQMAARFQEPRYADAFRYSRAVAMWYLGEEDAATSILQAIADAVYTLKDGREVHSENRDLAYYILAQIHHARRDVEGAAEYYQKVEDKFADAREVLQNFRAKTIDLEEVTTVVPGKKAELVLNHRNVEEAEILVYSVDLMTLYLRERNLSAVTSVNLAGISPTLRQTVQLGSASGMKPAEKTVELDLDKAGAYLVICRGDELHTSGLVLVSDIELLVKEDRASGRMRVQAIESEGGAFVRDVDVRVVGSGGSGFVSGRTDPRGLFIADGVAGVPTVIARLDGGHYAFHRGVQPVGVPEQTILGGELQQLEAGDYLDNVMNLNRENIQKRADRLQQEIQRGRKGVRIEQTK